MPKAERVEEFDLSAEKFFDVITDYESYPDFVDGVSSIKVLSKTESSARVEYSLNLIKKFTYVLKMEQKRPNKLAWSFESGDIFKSNVGSWEIESLAKNKIRVTYKIEVDIKGFVPGMIVDKLVSHNLPAMMKSYYDEAKSRKA